MSNVENAFARLKTARMAGGFKTATEFCQKFNIPISTYNMHETGRRKISPDVAEKYSELLGINAAWLITGIGTPFPNEDNLEDTSNLTESEYLELLNYKGNKKISNAINTVETIGNFHPILFSKIIIEILPILKIYNIPADLNFIAHNAIEIYKDITQATESLKDQLTMVSLAITIFKRQLQQQNLESNNFKAVTR